MNQFIDNPREYSRPETSRNWGWCSGRCYTRSDLAQNIKETQVDVLSYKECKIMGKSQKVAPALELCAGKKREYPTIERYYRIKNKKNGAFWFKLKVSLHLHRFSNNIYNSFSFRQLKLFYSILVMPRQKKYSKIRNINCWNIFIYCREVKRIICPWILKNENLNSMWEELMHARVRY